MSDCHPRRSFLRNAMIAAGLPALGAAPGLMAQAGGKKFQISLAEWSLHRAIRAGLMTNLDFPRVAREQFGIEGLEFVNALWAAPTESYVNRLKSNIRSSGTKAVLIMCDGEGFMGAPEKADRLRAADNHRKWVDITAEIGGKAIRTNMYPGKTQPSTPAEIEEFLKRCTESFARICDYAAKANINVIIENHGGVSSDPDVVVALMKKAGISNLGTLPDFGNFPKEMDRYEAVRKLMPYAKGVSLKCYDFTPELKETSMDLDRLMKIAFDAGFHGWVGIEYEGRRLTEFEGIQAAKRYLDQLLAG